MEKKLLEDFTPLVPNVYDQNGAPLTNVDYDTLEDMFKNNQAFFRKGEKISVIGPTGDAQELEATSVADALNQGYKLNTPDLQYEKALKEKYTTGTMQAAALGLGAARGLTIGLSDPMLEVLGVDMDKIRTIKELNETESVLGEVGGSIAPMFFTGGGSAAAKVGIEGAELAAKELGKKTIAQKVMQYSPTNLVNMAGRNIEEKLAGQLVKNGFDDVAKGFLSQSLVKSAPKVASQVFEGSIYGLGNALSEASLGDQELNAEYLAGQMGMGALIGASFGTALGTGEAAIPYVKKAYDATKSTLGDASKKTIANLFNVNENVLDKYIKNKSSIDQLDTNLAEITDQFVVKVDEINNAFKEGRTTLKDSTDAYNLVKKEYEDTLKQKQFDLSDEIKVLEDETKELKSKFQADFEAKKITRDNYKAQVSKLDDDLKLQIKQKRLDLKKERQVFDDLLKEKKGQLATDIDNDLLEAGTIVADDMQKLHNNVVQNSRLAFESPEINLQGTQVAIQPLLNKADDLATKLERSQIKENHLIGKKLREEIDEIWKASDEGYITGAQAKEYIQSWDKVTTYLNSATEFDKGMNLARKQLRYTLDDELKNANPLYRDLMKTVSEDVRLLKDLNRFGNEFEASRALRSIDRPDRKKYELEALKKLNDKFKGERDYDYITKIEKYLSKEDEILNLPEFKRLKEIQKETLDLDQKNLDINKTIETSEAFKGLKRAERELDTAATIKKSLGVNPKVVNAQKELDQIKKALRKPEVQKALKDTPEFQEMVQAQKNLLATKAEAMGLKGANSSTIKSLFKKIAENKAAPDEIRKFKSLIDFLSKNPDLPKSDILIKMLDDAGVLEYFEKSIKQGSRNVNEWAALGAVVGQFFDNALGGAGLGGFIGGQIDQMGPKMAKAMIDKLISLSSIEKMTMQFAKAQSQRINQFFGTKGFGQLGGEMIMPIVIQNQDKKEVKKKKNVSSISFQDSAKMLDKFNEITTNIANIENKLDYELADMSKYAPTQTTALKMKALEASQFLQSKMPKKSGIEYTMKVKTKPSDLEMRKFMKYWEAVDNPLVVFDSLEKGIVSPEQVEVLKTIYPRLYEETLGLITDNLTELQSELPYKKRLALSQFFGIALDPSMSSESVLNFQKGFTPEEKADTMAKMTGAEMSNVTNINLDLKKSASERIATRA